MAIAAATVWEVRTSGNADNGGGYSSGGTDYSQQDSAQLTLTDLAMTSGGTTLTSATGGFTSAMIGNIIKIKSGTNFVVGYYQITARTDTNTVTLDRDATNGSNASSGTGSVGGAAININDITNCAVGQNIIWVKSGTYLEEVVLADQGGEGKVISLIGYNSTRGDTPTGTNRPYINAESVRNYCIRDDESSSAVYRIENFRCANAVLDGITSLVYEMATFLLVNVKSSGNGGFGLCANSAHNCESSTNTDYGIAITGQFNTCNYSHDNGGFGFYGESVIGSSLISDSNSTSGFFGLSNNICNSIAYNNSSGSGFYGDGKYFNNISCNNGTYGFEGTLDNVFYLNFFDYNLYNGNGTAGLLNVTAGANDVTSAPSFTDAANGDFSLQAGSPAIDAGFPAHAMAGATV